MLDLLASLDLVKPPMVLKDFDWFMQAAELSPSVLRFYEPQLPLKPRVFHPERHCRAVVRSHDALVTLHLCCTICLSLHTEAHGVFTAS